MKPERQSFEVVRLKSGESTLRWIEGGETFHPGIGAENESRSLIVEQLQLGKRFASGTHPALRVWDVGLGAAGNASSILGAWKEIGLRPLELISFDASLEPLRLAWEAHRRSGADFPWLGKFPVEELMETGETRYLEGESRADWRMCPGDFAALMRGNPNPAWSVPDLIVYDFFSPARNYALWTLEHWKNLRRWLSDSRDTWIVFHSRSTALRVTLLLAGFYVGKGTALGNKEETTLACNRRCPGWPVLEEKWLEKVEKSSSAEPFVDSNYRASGISGNWLRQLRLHPQFVRLPA